MIICIEICIFWIWNTTFMLDPLAVCYCTANSNRTHKRVVYKDCSNVPTQPMRSQTHGILYLTEMVTFHETTFSPHYLSSPWGVPILVGLVPSQSSPWHIPILVGIGSFQVLNSKAMEGCSGSMSNKNDEKMRYSSILVWSLLHNFIFSFCFSLSF